MDQEKNTGTENEEPDTKNTAQKAENEDGANPQTGPKKDNLKEAWKQVENIGMAVGDALQGRSNVVMVRINDDALAYLDMLTEADMTKSRSESAAYLINEGINANQALFNRIKEVTEKIETLKAQLREVVKNDQEA
ncbi:MAG: hypothetical protein JEZ00_06355 [Anaerolineaceae bacterium]|nr:hypothetical protein [Anaerolineaceae bacterium]